MPHLSFLSSIFPVLEPFSWSVAIVGLFMTIPFQLHPFFIFQPLLTPAHLAVSLFSSIKLIFFFVRILFLVGFPREFSLQYLIIVPSIFLSIKTRTK